MVIWRELNVDVHLRRLTGMGMNVCCVIKVEYLTHIWALAHVQNPKNGTEQTVSVMSVPKDTIR